MSCEPAIVTRGVHKIFPMYDKPYKRLMELLDPRDGTHWRRDFHALKGIDLEISRGQTVGIIGRNGSGKSTLLQIICGTLAPSLGTVAVNGRIAALLELGAGFNPEFTGRENVFLNATILGLDRAQTEARLDDILAFAEIGEFIDQPVKNYSSGMYVRLAFAVAINVEPDILVVDEALSVGDEAFQRKCFARIEAIRETGATILFVSHSAGAVVDLCDHAVVLDAGEVIFRGSPKDAVTNYQKMLYAPKERQSAIRASIIGQGRAADNAAAAPGSPMRSETPQALAEGARAWFDPGLVSASTISYENKGVEIREPRVLTPEGEQVNMLVHGHDYIYTYHIELQQTLSRLRCGMMIRSTTGVEIGGFSTDASDPAMALQAAGACMEVRFRFRCLLNPGVYFLNAGCLADVDGAEAYVGRHIDVAMFRVQAEPALGATALVNFVERATVEMRS
ncbi:ABC transporter ATP-binding protein [Luteimonas terrae]|uniref:ABC transporter ATP-binding protein n=1 Tax=Luteimonas terrae TaxID=1530191 RepID=A0A4R5U6S6_9GAMM|nr:ABC transporter ATP-binding protein [Luteimonas terrae]TDK29986.1 ABC transporter ATP-binding protein [Luteimonas terrae]